MRYHTIVQIQFWQPDSGLTLWIIRLTKEPLNKYLTRSLGGPYCLVALVKEHCADCPRTPECHSHLKIDHFSSLVNIESFSKSLC